MKYLSILVGFMLLSSFAISQDHKFDVGATGGGDISWSQLSNLKHYPLGWSTGVTFQYNWTERFSLNSKFLYGQLYLRIEDSHFDTKTTIKSYAIPLTARWSLGKNNFKTLLDVGVQYLHKFKTIIDSEFKTGGSEYIVLSTISDDWGLVFGTGASYKFTDKLTGVAEVKFILLERVFANDIYSENSQLLLGLTYGL